ncbi:MAG: serine/threonine protein kinase [Labilithrix sp.]|nr:serine/threonine protein kinase [Labilithrix sp.]
MEAPESALVPGYRLDRYELLCPIASGGMASVWLARLRGKRGFEKLFAIKTIKTELISDPHFQEMFLDEARIASKIVHPNVAQILELGEQDDTLYIIMEYVDGDSLAKINRLAIKRGSPLPPGVSMRIVAEACAGLHAAHQVKDADGESLGVVHRDVSPQNILLTTEGAAKVIDFGLVKAKNRSAGETGQGVVKGKIRYMAPEQVASKGLDHRADVWAAGMCLYELLVGHTPYHTEDDLDVVKRLMSPDPLPPFDVALPPPIEKILAKAIVKDPDGRFESCAQMRRAIESAILELELPAENEHVAEFLKETLPDLASKRKSTIAKATVAAESRQAHADSLESLGPADMAFAATEVSAREASGDDTEVPLTRRRGAQDESDPDRTVSSYGASRTTSATSLREQLGERKKRGGAGLWIAGLVVAGAGAWILWPRAGAPTDEPAGSSSTVATASAAPSSSAAASAGSAELTTLELEDGDADVAPSRPATTAGNLPSPPASPTAAEALDAAPAAPTYNPAWSILTNPPEAGVPPPPTPTTTDASAPAPTQTSPAPTASTPPVPAHDEPK